MRGHPQPEFRRFILEDGVDQFLSWAFGAGTTQALRRKQQAILALGQRVMGMQQRGRLQHDGGTEKSCAGNKQCAQTCGDSIPGAQIGRAISTAIQDEQL
jgi:hypothetical protein